MKPHNAIVNGLAATTRIDVNSATAAPTSRSSSSGNEIAPSVSAITANTKPTAQPTTISVQPARVVNTSAMNCAADAGA